MITPKKNRKRRSLKAYDLCSCGYVDCDPAYGFGRDGLDKIHDRLRNKLCMGCGFPPNDCKCKSKE